jgi:Asp-tRNA(Asn)/Glu-tRNA(Gln) amidotransferase A subunit family amidase
MSLKKKIKKITSELDFIVVPSTFSQAPKIKHKEINDTSLIWTTMGYPCINIPFKYSKNSLPFGMLIISNEFNDFNLLEFCKKIKIKGIVKNNDE